MKISVIVPIYNVEKYLEKCLESLVNQTIIDDIEIICINDCSTDNCLKILNEYKAKYSNSIKIINHIKNCGVSTSRNDGLKIAKGEYVGFVDPDDWVDYNFFEKLYNTAIKEKADIVKGNLKIIYNNKVNEIYFKKTFKNENYFFSAIYKNNFIKKYSLKFPENIKIGEDIVFLTKANYFVNKIVFVEDIFYYYLLKRPDSLTTKNAMCERNISEIEFRKILLNFFNSIDIDKNKYIDKFNFLINGLIKYYNKVLLINDYTIANGMIELYKNCKYKKEYIEKYYNQYTKYLINNNPTELNDLLFKNKDWNIKLFGVLNIFSFKNKNFSKFYYRIFNLFPILKIKFKNNKKYFYIFGLLIFVVEK